MANRVLKRPMFRMGGSPQFEFQERTTGILSGLDGPKLKASRTGMKNGGTFAELIEAQDKASREYLGEDDYKAKAGMPGSMSSALMNFGLNLLAQPGGNLAGAIGKAGSPVLRQFQTAREAERLDKRKAERRRKGDVLDRAAEIYEAQIEAAGGGTDKTFEFSSQQQALSNLIDEKQNLIDKKAKLDPEKDKEQISIIDIQIQKNQDLTDKLNKFDVISAIGQVYSSEDISDMISDKQSEINPATGVEYTQIEASNEVLDQLAKLVRQKRKDGGRAGYQVGGEVVEDVSMMRETMAGPTPPAAAQTQDLTYDELRARLPREITDDVVTLIATSKQALTDFAEIQTQQDVDNFNQTYNVNLVLPQEG